MAIKSYPTDCTARGCSHEVWLDHRKPPIGADEPIPKTGDVVRCDCGQQASVRPAKLAIVGIIVEYESKQLGRTFRSNREMQDWLDYGDPIKGDDGETIGFRQRRLYSDDDIAQQEERGWREQEAIAAAHGRTLEEDAAFRAEGIKEKIAREVEAGQTPSVREVSVESMLPS